MVTGGSDRETQLDALRAGRLDLLLNCQVLVEGFDFPGLRTVFVRPSCRGPTIQMCGRVLRKHPAIPFKQVVQCQKTRWPFLKTALAAQQYAWTEESWRSLTVNPQIEAINRRTLKVLAGIRPELPKFLAKQRAIRRRGRPANPLRPENLSA